MLKIDINLAFTVINILIIYFLMKRFLFKPINRIIAARQDETDKAFEEARKTQEEADQAKVTYETSMKDIDSLKAQAVSEARKSASEEYQRIVGEASAKADNIVEDAKKNAEKEKEKIMKNAENEIAGIVLGAAAKIAAAKNDPANDAALYDQFLRETGKDD